MDDSGPRHPGGPFVWHEVAEGGGPQDDGGPGHPFREWDPTQEKWSEWRKSAEGRFREALNEYKHLDRRSPLGNPGTRPGLRGWERHGDPVSFRRYVPCRPEM